MVAKKVNHYYWMHSPSDDQMVRVENVQRVVELMTGKPIMKKLVKTGGQIIRGMTERYSDKSLIFIRDEQSLEWKRYAAIKEFCHIAYDEDSDFEPDPRKTLSQLVARRGLSLLEEVSSAMLSERLAEISALEIAYPLEFRRLDAIDLAKGRKLEEIVRLRGVPSVHVEAATQGDYIAACEEVWRLLPEVEPSSLI